MCSMDALYENNKDDVSSTSIGRTSIGPAKNAASTRNCLAIPALHGHPRSTLQPCRPVCHLPVLRTQGCLANGDHDATGMATHTRSRVPVHLSTRLGATDTPFHLPVRTHSRTLTHARGTIETTIDI